MRPTRTFTASALALGLGATYLGWRLFFSLDGAPGWLAWPALAIEAAGWIALACLLVALRAGTGANDRPSAEHPQTAAGATTFVVRTDGDRTVDDVRATLLAIGSDADTVVVDRVGRADIAAVAARLGARYEASDDALGLPRELPPTAAWVAVLDAGDVPRSGCFDALAATAAAGAATGVGVVQGLLASVADDSAEHDAAGRHERTFERRSLNPALGARGAAVWTGSGALLTRAAFDGLAALAPGARRSELEASVALRRIGVRIVAPADRALVVARPVNTSAGVRQRRRREIAAARRLLLSRRSPLVTTGLTWRQRVGLLAWCAHLLSGHRRAAFVAVLAGSLASGRLPFAPDPVALLALWLPWMVASVAAAASASGGTLRPGDRSRRSLALLGASVGRPGRALRADGVAVRAGVEAAGDRVLLAALTIVCAATVARTLADLGGDAAALPPAELAGLFAVALWVVGGGLDVLRLLARRTQRRAARRVPTGLPATIGAERVTLADVTPHGAGFLAAAPVAVGERIELHVVLPRRRGPGSPIVLHGTVRNRRPGDGALWRVGVAFGDVDPAAHDALVEYCAVAFPLRLLERHTAAPAAAERYVPAPVAAVRGRGALAPRLVALAMVTGVVTSLAPTLQRGASAAPTTPGTITVEVFRDYNANGVRNTAGDAVNPAVDALVGGATVTATCLTDDGPDATAGTGDGETYAAAATAADDGSGTYTFAGLAGAPCRVEVTALPAGFEAGPLGVDSGGLVQFASAGAIVRVGVAVPGEFCQNNPTIAAACATFGDQINGAHKDFGAVKAFPSTASGSAYDGTATDVPTALAEAQDVGTLFGAAYHRASRTILVSAMTKVYAGFGPGGPGGVYAVDADGGGASLLATVPNAGSLPARAGYAPSPSSVSGDWLADGVHWAAVGTSSLGDIELSQDQATLWVVNLNDRSLYAVDAATGAVAAPVAVPLGTGASVACDPTWVRPFGLGRDGAELLVGEVCAGPAATDLRAYVYGFVPATLSFTTTPVFEAGLGYAHGRPGNSCGPGASGNWNAWTATNMFDGSAPGADCAYPQPMLTDIELDDDGSLILGLRDRFGDQSGEDVPAGAFGGGGEGVSAGDLLRACPSGGGWALESAGACGGVTGAAVGSGEGPGGGEFYSDNFAKATGFGGNHQEVTIGGLAKVPGVASVLVTAFDPTTNNPGDWRAGGVRTSSNANGTVTRFFNLFDKCDSSGWSCPPGRSMELTFGKVNGLGDLVALCDEAPVEIGDRVWFDANGNGVQDPGEAGIAGVAVTVEIDADADGTVDTTTVATTDGAGRWVVSSDARPAGERPAVGAADDYGIAALVPGARVTVVAPTTVTYAGAAAALTRPDVATGGGATVDSDVAPTTGRSSTFAVAGAGVNDHAWDIGYTATYSVGDRVWLDADDDGAIGPSEDGIDGVTVRLYADAGDDGVPDGAALATQLTSSGGHYLFTGLPPGTYVVEVVTPAGHRSSTGTGGAAAVGPHEGAATPDPDGDADADDDGTATDGSGTVVRAKPVTLGPTEPTGEPATPGHADATADVRSNVTVDFGFFVPGVEPDPLASLGDRVWFDLDRNGRQDGGEAGVPNVTVTLLDSDGEPVAVTTTDAQGRYRFDDLVPGDYSVRFTDLPADHDVTTRDAAADDVDSDADAATGRTILTTLEPGEHDPTWDLGIAPRQRAADAVTVPPAPSDPSTTTTTLVTAGSGANNGSTRTSLPRTGAGVLSVTVIALALVLAGSVLVGAASGRRRDRAAA